MSLKELARRDLAQQRQYRALGLLAGLALLVALIPLSIIVGVTDITLDDAFGTLFSFNPENNQHLIVLNLRIPRTLLAIIVGAALGVAGAIMQALTRNPLADPGILGVNAGAAIAITVAISFFGITNTVGYMWFGLAGAAIAGAAVYLLGGARTGTNPVKLVLSGTALSVVLISVVQVIIVNNDEQVFDRYRNWILGSLQGRGTEVLLPVACLIGAGLLLSLTLSRSLDTVSLGSDLGTALGSSVVRTWSLSALAVIILAGAATAAAGPIGFVGLTAPHLARFITGPDHRWVLPYSALISALLMLGADVVGRMIIPQGEIGVGIMVALLGAPFFLMLVRKKKLVQL